MAEYKVRFIHHVSCEPLVYKVKEKDTEDTARQNTSKFGRKAERSSLLLQLLKDGVIKEEILKQYGFDINSLRRYTFVYTFPEARDGNFDKVAIAFCRQANGDQFIRSFGREVALSRLALLLTEGRAKTRRDYGQFAYVTDCKDLISDSGNLPEKIVLRILRSSKILSKAYNQE